MAKAGNGECNESALFAGCSDRGYGETAHHNKSQMGGQAQIYLHDNLKISPIQARTPLLPTRTMKANLSYLVLIDSIVQIVKDLT